MEWVAIELHINSFSREAGLLALSDEIHRGVVSLVADIYGVLQHIFDGCVW